jgi:pyruvate dehydrogenase E2 component (dihydrolipoamide acetyltransferase)
VTRAKVLMPPWGMGMCEGTITEWLKAEGDHVAEGDPLVEVETDKVTEVVSATLSGTLVRIAAQTGEAVEVQGLLAEIEPDADS